MSVTVHHGDSREVIAAMPDASVHAVCTDPPYALISISKRFSKSGRTDSTATKAEPYQRHARGFMGQQWDNGQTAFDPAFWADVLRVLKPGGHVVAFGGTRTYHRLACAIEDAGFEIRDQIGWLYGTGFPKSHDVSKGIDKRRDWTALPKLQAAVRAARVRLGISQSEAARRMGLIGPGESLGGGGFMWFETGMRLPTREQWPQLKAALSLDGAFDKCFEEAEREITGTVEEWTDRSNYALTSKDGYRRDNPASDAALAWDGWGTALKPAWEPIVLARKPLDSTVVGNVLQHGTGAINIDGCRVESGGEHMRGEVTTSETRNVFGKQAASFVATDSPLGRWPANIIHDGSDEVIAGFPFSASGENTIKRASGAGYQGNALGIESRPAGTPMIAYGDEGSAARFFYCAKADADDRIDSKHPTVKPVALMRWLVRLITPPGGTVLDPFAGTGTLGVAAIREGFDAILIEREPQYVADIRRRIGMLSGDDTPLFASAAQ